MSGSLSINYRFTEESNDQPQGILGYKDCNYDTHFPAENVVHFY